jgi:hypothetical protein
LRGREAQAVAAAKSLPVSEVLARSVDELTARIVEEHVVEPVTLDLDAMTMDKADAEISYSRASSFDRMPGSVPGTRISLFVPFSGEADLFKFRPSTYSTMPPSGRVAGQELILTYAAPGVTAGQITSWKNRELENIDKYLAWANGDVESFNERLPGKVRAAVAARFEKVRSDEDVVAALGLPLRRREDAPRTYVAPDIRRKPQIVRSGGTKAKAAKPEPIMAAEEYDHILGVVTNMVHVIERSPAAFAGMGEEDLRQHFLVQLNGQYEGMATGETFNYDGKTDILVRYEGRNVFIAECKFWAGPEGLTQTINQILGYASWRDTKLAIFVFNRDRKLSTVLQKVPEVIRGHPAFVREIDYGGETSFRAVLRRTDDPDRELTLTVLVFETPGEG